MSDMEVEVSEVKNPPKTQQGRSVILESPEPWDSPVDGCDLILQLVALLKKHIVADTDTLTVIAFWALHAHTFTSSVHTPRLNITAPEKGCGKTLVLDLLEHLTPKAMRTENLSSAVLFRLVDAQQPTLLIDEYDTFLRDCEDLRGALNAGWQRGGKHLRCEGDKHEVKAFSTFAPVALAGIKGLPPTLHDRSILIRMKRATRAEVVRIQHFDSRHTQELDVLCQKMVRWAIDHSLDSSDPDMPEDFYNRVADRWRHLFAIADAIGGVWPSLLRKTAKALEKDDTEESIAVMLLEDIRIIFCDKDKITSESLIDGLHRFEDRPWNEYGRQRKPITTNGVAHLLKVFGIKPGTIRIGEKTAKGYKREKFTESWERYLSPPSPPNQNVTPSQSSTGAGFSDSQSVTLWTGVTDQNQLKASTGAGCYGVTFQKGGMEGTAYPKGLFDAAANAVSGLKIGVGGFIKELIPDDYREVIDNPTVARAMAVSMDSRDVR